MPKRLQGFHHAATAVTVIRAFSNVFHIGHQPLSFAIRRPLLALQVVVKTAATDTHNPAQHSYRIDLLLAGYKLISQLDSLAKKAVAFFRMSLSIFNCLFLDRSRC